MNATNAELRKLQEAIADGRPPALPQGKSEVFYWHDRIAGFALRLYRTRTGVTGRWIYQYRNARGLGRRYKIGDAAALNLNSATNIAKRVVGDVANGLDPQGERKHEREKPKFTLGAIVKQFLDEGVGVKGKPLRRRTLKMYASVAKNHLGKLAAMQVDEIEPIHVRNKIKEVEKVGKHIANHTRALISTVYKWGRTQCIISTPNPVQSTIKLNLPKSRARALSLDELGAIWRACEDLATSPPRYKGNPWGGEIPTPANSIRAGNTLLTRMEAARQSGLHPSIIWKAIQAGDMKASFRLDVPEDHPANHPLKITQGKGHCRDYMIEAAEIERYTNSRLSLMRSPQAEYAAIVQLLMLIGGRYSEMGALRWSELDLEKGTLHIKGEETEERRGTKNGVDLELPLPPMAVAILKDIPRRPDRDFVFGSGPNGFVNNSRMKHNLDARIAEIESEPIKAWRHHDLRHSLDTQLNEKGIDSRIVETIVNHSSGHRKDSVGYNHAKYEKPIKQALELWAQTIRNVADGVEPDTNVAHVDFGKRSA